MENDVSALQAALAAAKAKVQEASRRLAPRHVGGEMEAYYAARDDLLLAERRLAEAERRPFAVRQECALVWDTGSPMPTLLQSDQDAFLLFLLRNDDDHVGLIEFESCASTCFGGPGDETFHGHPLYGSGFEGYEPMRVVNSPWIERLKKIDSVHHRHDPARYDLYNHFIFPFHDTTFECVARSFRASRIPGPHSQALLDVARRLPTDG